MLWPSQLSVVFGISGAGVSEIAYGEERQRETPIYFESNRQRQR